VGWFGAGLVSARALPCPGVDIRHLTGLFSPCVSVAFILWHAAFLQSSEVKKEVILFPWESQER
jgi:hypothetical protein